MPSKKVTVPEEVLIAIFIAAFHIIDELDPASDLAEKVFKLLDIIAPYINEDRIV